MILSTPPYLSSWFTNPTSHFMLKLRVTCKHNKSENWKHLQKWFKNLSSRQCEHQGKKTKTNSCHVLPGIKIATDCPCSQDLKFKGGTCPTVIPPGNPALCCGENSARVMWLGTLIFALTGMDDLPPSKCTAEKGNRSSSHTRLVA